jgi:hypothetical protein
MTVYIPCQQRWGFKVTVHLKKKKKPTLKRRQRKNLGQEAEMLDWRTQGRVQWALLGSGS